jgi:hypothetical protein
VISENYPFGTKFQQNSSCSSDKATLASPESSSFHATSLAPIKYLCQEKIKGEVLKTIATVVCLC